MNGKLTTDPKKKGCKVNIKNSKINLQNDNK